MENEILPKNYIGGTWQIGNGQKFQEQNPATGDKGNFTKEDVLTH